MRFHFCLQNSADIFFAGGELLIGNRRTRTSHKIIVFSFEADCIIIFLFQSKMHLNFISPLEVVDISLNRCSQ